jgi:hypothetical protein
MSVRVSGQLHTNNERSSYFGLRMELEDEGYTTEGVITNGRIDVIHSCNVHLT